MNACIYTSKNGFVLNDQVMCMHLSSCELMLLIDRLYAPA
jgi:hypothetical protein